ncbi:MAG: metal ABC transporter permease [Proteobacteria bacterium]|nr:metal ABC transporter permease [Pseudomonadota bacterium]
MEDFLIKSIFAGLGIAISTSLLGVFILWKGMSYFGDAISHSSLLGIALSSIFAINPILGLVIFALIFAILVNFLDRRGLYSKDTIIGIVSYSFLAFGLILIAIFPESVKLTSYLFGDIIAISMKEIALIYAVTLIVVWAMILWFNKLLLTAINKDLAIISGIDADRLKLKFLLLVALVIAISIKIIGIFLVTAMLILPAAIARNFSKTPIQMLVLTLLISLSATISGLAISLFYNLAASPAIIGVLAVTFFAILFSTALKRS